MKFINRNFILYLFGRNSSVFGDIVLNTALAIYVVELTKSPKLFGTILAVGYIPRLLFSTFSGTLVDRLPKKVTMVTLDILRGLILLLLFFSKSISITTIYIIVITFGIVDTFFAPASIAVIPKIIAKKNMAKANSIDSTVGNVLTMLSPLIAVIIYNCKGIYLILLLDSVTFIISGFSELLLKFNDSLDNKSNSFKTDFLSGFKLLKRDKRLASLLLNGTLTHLFLTPFIEVGLTSILLITFKAPDFHYGIVKGFMSASAIIAGIVALVIKNKSISKNINRGIIGMIISVISFLILLSNSFFNFINTTTNAPVIYLSLCSFMIAFSFGYYAVFFRTFYQSEVPQDHLGKFMSIFMICVSLARIIGMYGYGILFENYSIMFPLIILAIGMLLKLITHIPFIAEDNKIKSKLAS